MIETVTLFLITNVLAQMLKAFIYPRFGVLGVQAVILGIALIGAVVWSVALQQEAVMSALMHGVQIFTYAIAFYEVILKRIDVGGIKLLTTKDL